MSPAQMVTDGSSVLDAPERVVIDPEDDEEPLRWRCPNGHSNWSPTNSHIWCQSCARAAQHDPEVDAEHYEIVDAKTDETISWSAVDFEG